MKNLSKLDSLADFNDLLIELNFQKTETGFDKDLLIRQSFILWYSLVEGYECESFDESELSRQLQDNFKIFKGEILKDADCIFIFGWAISISFWLFDKSIEESNGKNLLYNSYKLKPGNLLFKWAVRKELQLNNNEIDDIRERLQQDFDSYFDFGPVIRKYLLDLLA